MQAKGKSRSNELLSFDANYFFVMSVDGIKVIARALG